MVYINQIVVIGGVRDSDHGSRLPPHQVVDSFNFTVTPAYKDHGFLHQKYVEEKLSIKQISALISSSKEAVRRGLKEAGIKLRQHGKQHGHPSQPRFGKRLQRGKEVDHKTEQKVIKVVKELHAQRMTLRQIAQTLSELGVPTKCRGRGWHPEMVRRVLKTQSASLATTATVPSKTSEPSGEQNANSTRV